jgi:ABC-2 type transport system permease protein
MMEHHQTSSMEKTNWVGIWTLVQKECGRFLNVYLQTIVAPVVTTFLFYVIFTLAFGGNAGRGIEGIPYMQFLVPGLIMMAMAQNAFANTASSIVIGKVQGNIIDVLMPPLAPWELLTGYIIGGVCRGLMIGLLSILVLVPFIGIPIHNIGIIAVFGVLGTAMLALLGVVGGIWSDKFDHIAAVTNFVVMPMTFLSGTFYSIDRLPPLWQDIAHANPFFFMIDGFRAGFIGVSDMSLWIGVAVLLVVNIALWTVAYRMLKTGYKIKS